MTDPLAVITLGRLDYAAAYLLQRRICDLRIAGDITRDVLLLVEHESTITLGRGTARKACRSPRKRSSDGA